MVHGPAESVASTSLSDGLAWSAAGGVRIVPERLVIGPVDGTRVPRYAGAATFARLPRIDETSDFDVAVLGAPFDGGVSYRPGARFGPSAIRQASRHLRPAYDPNFEVAPFRVLQ